VACSNVVGYKLFRELCCFLLQGVFTQQGPPKRRYPTSLHGIRTQKATTWQNSFTLKMETARSSEMFIFYHITTLHQNPEDRSLPDSSSPWKFQASHPLFIFAILSVISTACTCVSNTVAAKCIRNASNNITNNPGTSRIFKSTKGVDVHRPLEVLSLLENRNEMFALKHQSVRWLPTYQKLPCSKNKKIKNKK